MLINPYIFSSEPSPPPDPVFWVSADYGITKDVADVVSAWENQGTDTANLGGKINSPTWRDAIIGGEPVVTFTSDSLAVNLDTTYDSQVSTLFIVCKINTSYGNDFGGRLLDWGAASQATLWEYCQENIQLLFVNQTDLLYTPRPVPDTALFVVLLNGDDSTYRRNGAKIEDGTVSGTYTDLNYLRVGGQASGTQWALDTDVAEIRIFDAALTIDQIQTIESELMDKYGLS